MQDVFICLHMGGCFDKIECEYYVGGTMKLGYFFAILMLFPGVADAATRASGNARVGTSRASQVGARMPSMSVNTTQMVQTVPTKTVNPTVSTTTPSGGNSGGSGTTNAPEGNDGSGGQTVVAGSESCREAYRACMDEFCLLDESEGYRCACSSNINESKSLIQEIQEIQEEADLLYTEGVEREQMGAQARLVLVLRTG